METTAKVHNPDNTILEITCRATVAEWKQIVHTISNSGPAWHHDAHLFATQITVAVHELIGHVIKTSGTGDIC